MYGAWLSCSHVISITYTLEVITCACNFQWIMTHPLQSFLILLPRRRLIRVCGNISGTCTQNLKKYSLRFQSLISHSLISHKWAKLGIMLLLTTDRKIYMGSPMTPSHLNLSDIERSKSRSLGFQSLIQHKVTNLGPMSVLTINKKICIWSWMTPSDLTLSDLKGQSQGHSDFKAAYLFIYLRTYLYRVDS